jgi:hypothetical protein
MNIVLKKYVNIFFFKRRWGHQALEPPLNNIFQRHYIKREIGWLVIYGFTSCSRIFHLYGDVTMAGEGLQNLGLCSALRAFEQGGISIVPHLL